MKRNKQKHKRQLTVLLSLCAALIVVAAVEAVILANPEAYQFWLTLYPEGGTAEYSSIVLSIFLVDIVVPAGLALYTFFSINKLGTPPMYRLIWGAIVFLAGIRRLLRFQTESILWYLALALWAVLFLVVINIHRMQLEEA
ncbi:MAG: hypothetical protein PHR78_03245 [Eubacteriales bacterium]|nr:hypothetical protein [Eubacteriales bacterium]MDD4323505.1 hypothetical protein [Eubacteriales bacterium]MDD4541167.1 hypothetical protein [Eubacteriales bacterium]